MSEYAVSFQNQPVDVSEEFSKQENHFFIGSRVEEFDPRSAGPPAGGSSPKEVLSWVTGMRFHPKDLERVFFSSRFSRKLDDEGAQAGRLRGQNPPPTRDAAADALPLHGGYLVFAVSMLEVVNPGFQEASDHLDDLVVHALGNVEPRRPSDGARAVAIVVDAELADVVAHR